MGVLTLSAIVQAVFVAGTENAELLTSWVPDDAFYYLHPAWMFGEGEGFTFDGLSPTYGFQPLWGLALGVVAFFLPSKTVFLYVGLLLGSLAHLLTGALLFACFERWRRPAAGAIAATLWLLNPELVRVQATGLESGLVGVLLLSVLLHLPRAERTVDGMALFRLGALCGFLFLARVSLLPVIGITAALLLRSHPVRSLGPFFLGAALPVVPWCLYATLTFGQPLPTSGTRKLVGAWAGLARFASSLPGIPPELARSVLSPPESQLFDSRWMAYPSLERLYRLGARATAGWALGHWIPGASSPIDLMRTGGALALSLIAGLGWRRRLSGRVPGPWVLIVVGGLNGALHQLLLSPYVEYAYWYRVPELLAVVTVTALALAPACEHTGRLGRLRLALMLGLGVLGGASFATTMAPRSFDSTADRQATAVLSVAESMNSRLPAGTLVGSWNAGLLGWVADGPRVVNLDGLANTRAFLSVARDEVLFREGYLEANPILRWIDSQDIRYLVDLELLSGLGHAPFYDVIPANRVHPEVHSQPVSHWTIRGRQHVVALVRLTTEPL